MKSMQPGKRFVALSAAVAIGLGGVALTVPALATNDAPEELSVAAAATFNSSQDVAAVGYGADGEIVVQVVEGSGLTAESDELEAIAAFAEATTDGPLVTQEIAEGYSAVNATDVVGGAGYGVAAPGTGSVTGLCSFGFPATNAAGDDVIITAGHCSDVGNEVFLSKPSADNAGTGDIHGDATFDFLKNTSIGSFTHSQFGPQVWEGNEDPDAYTPENAQDFAVITLSDSALETHGEVTDWESAASDDLFASTRDITGVADVTSEHVGDEIWRSGRTSGMETGTIGSDVNASIGIVDGYAPIGMPDGSAFMVHGFAAKGLAIPGDSGGAVVMDDKAVGVVSGSNYSPVTEEGTFIWSAELDEGLQHLDGEYTIKTAGDDEESPEPTPTDTASPTPTATPTETSSPTPTETDDAVDAELVVDPQEIAAERFLADDEEHAIAEDRGVTYAVSGVEPGAEVTFDTYASADSDSANAGAEAAANTDAADAPAKSVTVTADDNGNAGSRVWGLTTAPAEAYIGEYQVVVSIEGGETLNGGFSVVGEDGGEGGQDDGGDLPRTGSTVAPLAAGAAGLLALGGALTYIARRRNA